ncbi:MAG: hypothetical protein RMK29_21245 [Myxococcales bacterium]|nr:hypothetical protein [Myxococcota bacterium]MDW8284237.1 hypothetical protein [Myxococcales bacterium]
MRRVVVLTSHSAFQNAVLRAVLAGGVFGFLTSVHLPVWLLGCLFVLLLGAALVPPRGLRQGALLLLLGLLGASRAWVPSAGPWVGALGLGLWVGLAGAGLPAWQRGAATLATMLLAAGAARLPGALERLEVLAGLPGALPSVLCGLGMGLIVGSAVLVRQLRLVQQPVGRGLEALLPPPEHTDEISDLVRQAFATYREAAGVLIDQPQAVAAAEDLLRRITQFGRRWAEIEDQARRCDRARLQQRHHQLGERLAATQDEQARAEYERARAALDAQLGYLADIDIGRERAVARLHHQVATLERLRLAALRHRSVDAARMGEELKAVLEDLARAGQELDAATEALAEVPV